MGLVIQDGKLLIRPMLDGDGNPVLVGNGNPKNALATATRPSEACDCCTAPPDPVGACCYLDDTGYQCEETSESRCNELGGTWHEGTGCKSDENPDGIDCDTPVVGRCCIYPYNSSGLWPANTEEEAIRLASESAEANSSSIEGSVWTVGYTNENNKFIENAAQFDAPRNQWLCQGFWTTGEQPSCLQGTEDNCPSFPFSFWEAGVTCDDGCPELAPQPKPSGVCLYREDGEGTCTEYALNGDYLDGFASEAEAQAAGDAACQYPDAPECYDCRADVQYEGDDNWSYTLTFREFTYDEEGNITGCEKLIIPNVTETFCGGDPLADAQWENNLPPTHCRPVDSEDECTESTGVFCPNVSDCNQIDFDQGCPEWGCCLFCPEQPSSLPCGCADGYTRYGNDNPCGTAGIFQPGKTCEDLGYESNRSNPLP